MQMFEFALFRNFSLFNLAFSLCCNFYDDLFGLSAYLLARKLSKDFTEDKNFYNLFRRSKITFFRRSELFNRENKPQGQFLIYNFYLK